MTPEQVEKVKAALRNIQEIAGKDSRLGRIWNEAEDGLCALAALNGEPREEVWTVGSIGTSRMRQAVIAATGEWIADCHTEAEAARIARLPALERAARKVTCRHQIGFDYLAPAADIIALAAALADKPEGQP